MTRMLTDRTTYETTEKYHSSTAPFVDEDTSVVGIANVLLRSRLVIAVCGAFIAVAAVLNARIRPEYTATSMFVPQATERGTSQLAGLAAQFGFNVAGTSNGDGPDFYAQLIKSRDLLREAALTRYPLDTLAATSDSARKTLVQLFGAGGQNAEVRVSRTVDRLDQLVSARAELKVGIVTLRTSAKTPELAIDINRRLLALVNDFNMKKRQSQAAAERRFVEERLKNAQASLDAAEQRLTDFMSSNRGYHGSPQLTTEAARLQRRVDLEQEVFTTLAKSAEQARIEEVRNTP